MKKYSRDTDWRKSMWCGRGKCDEANGESLAHNDIWVTYTIVNGLDFELRANEAGIPALWPWISDFFLSEPKHSLCEREQLRHSVGLFGRLDGKKAKMQKCLLQCLAHSRNSTKGNYPVVIVKVKNGSGMSLRKQSQCSNWSLAFARGK